MHWARADSSDFGGQIPAPRSGHTAVSIGKSKVVVFGGFADKRFLSDIAVYDVGNKPHRLLRLIASATIQTIDSV
jgi:hypothetical protein